MRVLITGGGGFIGSHLVRRLLHEGHEVRVLDNFATGHRANLTGLDAEVVEGDMQSFERALTAARGCEVVLHQAALPSVPRSIQDPLTTNMVNVTGTLNVLLAARDSGVRRVVFASSSSVYGANPELPKREDLLLAPVSPYAASKQAGESYCRAFTNVYGLECVALRYFNVFGPRQDPASQYAAVVPRFLEAALQGRPLTVFGDGEQSRDFTFVDNVVEANMLALDAPDVAGEVMNVACGARITLNEVIREIEALLDRTVLVERQPARAGDVPHSMADIAKARRLLSFEPTVGFGEGLRRTADAFPAVASPATPA